MADVAEVATPTGPGRLHVHEAGGARAVLVLGAGASGAIDSPDLLGLARSLPGSGVTVARFEQPWRVAGRRIGPRAPLSDPAFQIAVAAVRARWAGRPVVVGGRSAGARIACRTYTPGLLGVVALSFPLHPPGKPDSSRVAELAGVRGPVLVVIGARDPFGSPLELSEALATSEQRGPREVVVVPGATHSFPGRTVGTVVDAVAAFMEGLLG